MKITPEITIMYGSKILHKTKKIHIADLDMYSKKDSIKKHIEDCKDISEKTQSIEMPEEVKSILKYTIHHKKMRVSFVIFTDFEALSQPVDKNISESTRQTYDQIP